MSTRILRASALLVTTIAMFACSGGTENEGDFDDNGPSVTDGAEEIDSTGEELGTSRGDKAIKWFHNHKGSTAYEHYCEKAVENSYGRTGVYASAIADWKAQGSKRHPGNMHPPRGALVFWKTSVFGHVGVADGNGGFCSTSIGGRISCAKLPYFQNYLGWAPSPF